MRATPLILTAALSAFALLAACDRARTPASQAAPTTAGGPDSTAPTPAAPGPVNPDARVTTYRCEDGRSVDAGYPDSETAVVTIGGHAYTLKVARSGSGARYTGMGWQWWTKGMTDAQLAPLKPGEDIASARSVACVAKDAEPPAPGTPGGLPDDRTPVSEAPFRPESAQGAANVVQTYFALLEGRDVSAAAKLRTDHVREDLSPYLTYHAQVGAPGRIEGAAGSLYVEAPIVLYGRLRNGGEFHRSGKAILRRANDVPGSTPEQRRWRIYKLEFAS